MLCNMKQDMKVMKNKVEKNYIKAQKYGAPNVFLLFRVVICI